MFIAPLGTFTLTSNALAVTATAFTFPYQLPLQLQFGHMLRSGCDRHRLHLSMPTLFATSIRAYVLGISFDCVK
jgi:hypothetical protein